MKIHELATELNMDVNIVLEKAQSMGIDVHDKDSILKDMDAKAIKNIIQIGHKGGDTKIVKATPKKAEAKRIRGAPKTSRRRSKTQSGRRKEAHRERALRP